MTALGISGTLQVKGLTPTAQLGEQDKFVGSDTYHAQVGNRAAAADALLNCTTVRDKMLSSLVTYCEKERAAYLGHSYKIPLCLRCSNYCHSIFKSQSIGCDQVPEE